MRNGNGVHRDATAITLQAASRAAHAQQRVVILFLVAGSVVLYDDFILCVIYAPTRPHNRQREGMLQLTEWVNIQLLSLPSGTTPILFMDANASVGASLAQVIGPSHSDYTNWNGHYLVLLNTWWAIASGSTWTDGRGHFSRIDYIAVP
eukprot:12440494-Heterocapsa_arctica.AAC.1